MKHATDRALDSIEPLLGEIRKFNGLVERKRGIWYLSARAFLHFHEDPAGIFADVKVGSGFQRFRVQTALERRDLLRRVKSLLVTAQRS
jgi:hypothetical protein